jgi:hypothetical protein
MTPIVTEKPSVVTESAPPISVKPARKTVTATPTNAASATFVAPLSANQDNNNPVTKVQKPHATKVSAAAERSFVKKVSGQSVLDKKFPPKKCVMAKTTTATAKWTMFPAAARAQVPAKKAKAVPVTPAPSEPAEKVNANKARNFVNRDNGLAALVTPNLSKRSAVTKKTMTATAL